MMSVKKQLEHIRFCLFGKTADIPGVIDLLDDAIERLPDVAESKIKQNRMGGSLIECGAIHALFEDIVASEVSATSGAQSAFDAARAFIKEMIANQCKLARCRLRGKPYGEGDEHTDECWFGKRRKLYEERNKTTRIVDSKEMYEGLGFGPSHPSDPRWWK